HIALREPGREKVAFNKEKVILDYFKSKKTATQIAKEYGVHKVTIAKFIRKQGHVLRKHTLNKDSVEKARKYNLNEKYFNKIDNPEKAYWLGFFAADGYIGSDGSTFGFKISVKDTDHLK